MKIGQEVLIVVVLVVSFLFLGVSESGITGLFTAGPSCSSIITETTTLTSDILGCKGQALTIQGDGIVLDCAGHMIHAEYYDTDKEIGPRGIKIIGDGNTVTNCVVDLDGPESSIGIHVFGSNNVVFDNVIDVQNDLGVLVNGEGNIIEENEITARRFSLQLSETEYNMINNNIITATKNQALRLYQSYYNQINGNTMKAADTTVVYVYDTEEIVDGENILTSNKIVCPRSYTNIDPALEALTLDNANIQFYNNYVECYYPAELNNARISTWYVEEEVGERVFSIGETISGNYWGNPDRTGFSDRCADQDKEGEEGYGFCDEPMKLGKDQIDSHPATGPSKMCGAKIRNSDFSIKENIYCKDEFVELTEDYAGINCNGHTIHAIGDYAVYAEDKVEVEIRDCNIILDEGIAAIGLKNVENSEIKNNQINSDALAVEISGDGNEIIGNGLIGGEYAISLDGENNLIRTNVIQSESGVVLGEGSNKWSEGQGGNYWTNSDGTGFSDTCLDENQDGFCDEEFYLDPAVQIPGESTESPNVLEVVDNVDHKPISSFEEEISVPTTSIIDLSGSSIEVDGKKVSAVIIPEYNLGDENLYGSCIVEGIEDPVFSYKWFRDGEEILDFVETVEIDLITYDGYVRRRDSSPDKCLEGEITRFTEGHWIQFGGSRLDYGYPGTTADRAFVEWDISELAGKKIIKTEIIYEGNRGDSSAKITKIDNQPLISNDIELWDDIGDGVYVDNYEIKYSIHTYLNYRDYGVGEQIDFVSDLQAAIDSGRGWFALGFASDNECPDSIPTSNIGSFWSQDSNHRTMKLIVTYIDGEKDTHTLDPSYVSNDQEIIFSCHVNGIDGWANSNRVVIGLEEPVAEAPQAVGGGGGGGSVATGGGESTVSVKPQPQPEILEPVLELIEEELKETQIFEDVNANEEFEFDIKRDLPITGMTIILVKNSEEVSLTVEELIEGLEIDTLVYKYLDISSTEEIGKAQIKFKVENTWLANKGLSEGYISLFHFDEVWVELPTEFVGRDGVYAYFTAETRGFSPFIIGQSKSAAATGFGIVETEILGFSAVQIIAFIAIVGGLYLSVKPRKSGFFK